MSRTAQCAATDALLQYWLRHPERQDSFEGIVEWWLLEERIERAIQQMRAALEELVERDLVFELRGSDGRIYYRLNVEKALQIQHQANAHPRRKRANVKKLKSSARITR